MPALAAVIAWCLRYLIFLLLTNAGAIGLRLLTFFGLSVVTHTVPHLPDITGTIHSAISGSGGVLAGQAIKALAAVRFDTAVTIVVNAYIAAYVSRVAVQAAGSATSPPVGDGT